ncbi:MAG: aldo/keto reductase [Pseudoxanthomonas sp.]
MDKTFPLHDGNAIPAIGFGTWPMDDGQARQAVRLAVHAGYRLIDTAASYGNEHGVGLGLRDAGSARRDIFLTSKLRGADQGFDGTLRAFQASLERLGTDYLDLYLIHWPLPRLDKYVDSWKAMVRLQREGRVRSIGVSNFLPAHIERLQAETGVLPAVNQVELHPDFQQPALREAMAARGIQVESWSPLGRGKILSDPALQRIAAAKQRSVAQVILRWQLQLGLVAIPKSQDARRIAQNAALWDFELDPTDMAAIAALDAGARQGGDPATHEEF